MAHNTETPEAALAYISAMSTAFGVTAHAITPVVTAGHYVMHATHATPPGTILAHIPLAACLSAGPAAAAFHSSFRKYGSPSPIALTALSFLFATAAPYALWRASQPPSASATAATLFPIPPPATAPPTPLRALFHHDFTLLTRCAIPFLDAAAFRAAWLFVARHALTCRAPTASRPRPAAAWSLPPPPPPLADQTPSRRVCELGPRAEPHIALLVPVLDLFCTAATAATADAAPAEARASCAVRIAGGAVEVYAVHALAPGQALSVACGTGFAPDELGVLFGVAQIQQSLSGPTVTPTIIPDDHDATAPEQGSLLRVTQATNPNASVYDAYNPTVDTPESRVQQEDEPVNNSPISPVTAVSQYDRLWQAGGLDVSARSVYYPAALRRAVYLEVGERDIGGAIGAAYEALDSLAQTGQVHVSVERGTGRVVGERESVE